MKPTLSFYKPNSEEQAPLLTWLDSQPEAVRIKFVERIDRLGQWGTGQKRPNITLGKDGICILRAPVKGATYLVYCLTTSLGIVLCHGGNKEPGEIEMEFAAGRGKELEANFRELVFSPEGGQIPARHFYSPAAEYLYYRYVLGEQEREKAFAAEVANSKAGRKIYETRVNAGQTHSELADKMGTTDEIVHQLENADFDGDAGAMVKAAQESVVGPPPIIAIKENAARTASIIGLCLYPFMLFGSIFAFDAPGSEHRWQTWLLVGGMWMFGPLCLLALVVKRFRSLGLVALLLEVGWLVLVLVSMVVR